MSSVSSTSSAVDGLISGLDTSSIITKLLAVDAAPQTQMKNGVTTAQAKVTAYQAINTKIAALQTAAESLSAGTAWTAATALVTGVGGAAASVTATATAGATPGSLTLNVTNLAASKSVMTPNEVDDNDSVSNDLGFPLDVVRNGVVVGTLSPSTGTLSEVAAVINKATNLGLNAVAVRVADNKYRLQLTSTTPGAAGDFTLSQPVSGDHTEPGTFVDVYEGSGPAPTSGSGTQGDPYSAGASGWDTLTLASDAKATITTASGNVIDLKSKSNTFTDLMPGVSVTATAKGQSTITVASDPSAVAKSVQALVDAANAALAEIDKQGKAGTISSSGTNTGAGALNGDSALRQLKSQIIQGVTSALGDGGSAAKYGIQSTSTGTIVFDQKVFLSAYTADPKGTQKALAPTSLDSTSTSKSVVERLVSVAKGATDSTAGTLTTAIKGQNSTITDLTKRISDWDLRLTAKKAYYQKYYANLEVALGKLQSQSTWLSSQLSSLNSGS